MGLKVFFAEVFSSCDLYDVSVADNLKDKQMKLVILLQL